MSQLFTIENDKIVITKLALTATEGTVTHTGDITVSGTLTVDNLIVNNQDTTSKPQEVGNWIYSTEEELQGKGLTWGWGDGIVQLMYKEGNTLWTNSDFDIGQNKAYHIDNIPVLSLNELGPQVTKSRLKEVGPLKNLTVLGDTALAEFAVFNSTFNRLGLNTDSPNSTLSVVDNDVEIILGSTRDGLAHIGTYTHHDLEIITDNTQRITVKSTGEIVFGNELTKNADVRIYGTLTVDTVVSDNRIDRYAPLEFKASRNQEIYGQGLVWSGTGAMRQFIMMSGPDRLWSSESLDLANDQSYSIGGAPVISGTGLGPTVVNSNLSNLGTLESLTVEGEATFLSKINASRALIDANTITFGGVSNFSITNSVLSAESNFSIKVANDETYYADQTEITIGNSQNNRRPVKVFGPLSVGVNTPQEGVDLTVKGPISFDNKKFVTGNNAPVNGEFNKGDICWNNNPTASTYVGWICTEAGSPGVWLPFGAIARQ